METLLTELAKLGIPGLFIAYLMWCCVEKDKKYDKREAVFDALHEQRVSEGKENAKAMVEAAQALKQLSESIAVAVETTAAASRAMVEATKEMMEATRKMMKDRGGK